MYFGKIMSLNFVMKRTNLICAHLFLPNPIFNFQYYFSWTVSWTFLRNLQFLQTATLRQEHPAPSFPLCRWDQLGQVDTLAYPREATDWRRTHKIATGVSFCMFWALLKGPLSFLSFLLCSYTCMNLHNGPLLVLIWMIELKGPFFVTSLPSPGLIWEMF